MQPQPHSAPAGDTGGPPWAQREFSVFVEASIADEVRDVQFCLQLLALLERVASEAATTPGSEVQADQAPIDGSEEALDVQIVREVLQLVVACARSESAALAVILRDRPLHKWLLACGSTGVRLEIAAAVHALCCYQPALVLPPSGDAASTTEKVAVRTASLATLRELLPSAEDSVFRCRQFFELYQALLSRECAAGELDVPEELCSQLVVLVREHPMLERRDQPEFVDMAQLGYMSLLLALVHARPALKAHLGRGDGLDLVNTLFQNLFFLPALDDARRLGPAAPPKCKSTECRSAALGLLLEMADGDADNLSSLTSMMLTHQQQRGGGPRAQWHFMPAAQEKARCGYVGLKNLGATCYLNSLFQQLFMVPAFRNALLALPIKAAAPPAADAGGAQPATLAAEEQHRILLSQLQLMFGYLQESEKKWFDTRELCGVIRDAEGAAVNPSIQMDADEFFMQLFEQLEGALKETPQADLLKKLFQGQMVMQMLNKDTKQKYSERLETWFTISIDIKSKKSVLDALDHFFEGEVLDGDNKYKTEEGEYVEAIKRSCVHTLPAVLILHLKRFEFDFDLMKKFKINDHCEFPATIKMHKYTASFIEQQERAGAAAEGDASMGGPDADSESPSDDEYKLVGVLVHSGTSDSGHYYSFVKERQAGPIDGGESSTGAGDWMHFNDTLVEPFDPRDIPKCCYGGVETVMQYDAELHKQVPRTQAKPNSAYMLFYERVQHPSPASESAPAEAAGAAGAAAAEGDDSGPDPLMQLTTQRSSSLVPEHIVRAVWKENMQFLRDRYVFDAIHFHSVRRLVGLALPTTLQSSLGEDALMPTVSQEQIGERALQLGCRFFVETLAHAKDKGSLPEWVALLLGGLRSSLPACRWLLQQAQADDWLRQMLLVCTVADVRTGFAEMLLCAMRCLRPTELQYFPEPQAAPLAEMEMDDGDDDLDFDVSVGPPPPPPLQPVAASLQVVQALLTMLHEAPSHWRHFPQFFLVLLEFAHLGAEERAWLLRKRVVSKLINFYLGDESPLATDDVPHHQPKRTRMGDKFAQPNLEHMLALISLLARSAVRPVGLEPERTPFSLEGPLLKMARREHELAVCEPFLRRVLREGLNVQALSELVRHYCWESPAKSKLVLDTVLHGIDTMDSEALGPYLHIFMVITCLTDAYHQQRLNYDAMPQLLHVIDSNMRYKQATIACLRMLTNLCVQDAPRRWMLDNLRDWLRSWLMHGNTDAVRVTAEELTCSILTSELLPREQAGGTGPAPPPQHAPAPMTVITVYDHLLQLLQVAREIARDSGPDVHVGTGKSSLDDQPSPRLAPYLRVCAWCVRHVPGLLLLSRPNTAETRFVDVQVAYHFQDGHHWECDETKLEMIRLWHDLVRAPQPDGKYGPLALASTPASFRKLLDTFVSLRPNERFLQYNREFLPPFYGLLRAVLSSPAGPQCALVLQTHRNWEWAIRYVLVESPDYTQLPAEGELEKNLGPSLMFLLRASCASPEFRSKVLNTTLGVKKLPHNAANVLTLLELTIGDEDGLDAAIELGAPQQLCSCLEGMQAYTYIEGQRLRTLHGLLHLIFRLAQRIRMQVKDDEQRRQQVLAQWDATQGCQSLLNVVFVLLRHSLRLRPEPRSSPAVDRTDGILRAVPPEQLRPLQVVCFDLAIVLAALTRQWASLIVGSLVNHHTCGPLTEPPATPVAVGPPAPPPATGGEADAAEVVDVLADRPETLAGLSLSEARKGAASNAERLCSYYEFAQLLIMSAVKAHDDANVVSCCMRLAVVLATETSVLPPAHAQFTQLLTQVAKAQPSIVANCCAFEEGEALLRRLLAEEPSLLHHCADSREFCAEMLRLAPPPEAQLCSWLDACAAQIAELRGGGSGVANAEAEMDGLQHAVTLLRGVGAAMDEHWKGIEARNTAGL